MQWSCMAGLIVSQAPCNAAYSLDEEVAAPGQLIFNLFVWVKIDVAKVAQIPLTDADVHDLDEEIEGSKQVIEQAAT